MPSESEFSRHRTECDAERKDLCDRLSVLELARAKEEGASEANVKWRRWVTRECRRARRHREIARERWRREDAEAKRRWKAIIAICAGSAGSGGGLVYALKHLLTL